jgi:hypothetical protein
MKISEECSRRNNGECEGEIIYIYWVFHSKFFGVNSIDCMCSHHYRGIYNMDNDTVQEISRDEYVSYKIISQ